MCGRSTNAFCTDLMLESVLVVLRGGCILLVYALCLVSSCSVPLYTPLFELSAVYMNIYGSDSAFAINDTHQIILALLRLHATSERREYV